MNRFPCTTRHGAAMLMLLLLTTNILAARDSGGSDQPTAPDNVGAATAEYLPGTLIFSLRPSYPNSRTDMLSGIPALDNVLNKLGVWERIPLFPQAPYTMYEPQGPIQDDYYRFGRVYMVRFSAPYDAMEAAALVQATGTVEFAEPHYVFETEYTPNDPSLSEQYYLDQIRAAEAWEITTGDSTVIIAIVDSGVEWMHEDLIDNIYINPGEWGKDGQGRDKQSNGIDDDLNGYVDDYHGIDLIGNPTLQDYQQGKFTPDNDPTPRTVQISGYRGWHGTTVTGPAGASGNNQLGIAGVAHGCRILPVKASGDSLLSGSVSAGYQGIIYAADMGADIINCSFGGEAGEAQMQALRTIVEYAAGKGALIVAAAGNNDSNNDLVHHYPSDFPSVLSVGATRPNGNADMSFSNYGYGVRVWAPGVNIMTTYTENGYRRNGMSGTSVAAPVVSGIAALIRSIHPDWSPEQIAMQIRVTGDRLSAEDSLDLPLRYRRANAHRALTINSDFSGPEGTVLPGLELVSYKIVNSTTGLLDTIRQSDQTVDLALVLKNHLAPTRELRIRQYGFTPIAVEDAGTLSPIGTDRTITVKLPIRLDPDQTVFNSELDIQLVLQATDGEYEDFFVATVPVRLPGWKQQKNPLEDEGAPVYAGTGVAAVNPNVAWAIMNVNDSTSYVSRVSDGRNWSTFRKMADNEPLYCITALTNRTAWIGSGPDNGKAAIYKTTDGFFWDRVDVSSITGFVNGIHFFDENEGIFVGDPLKGRWGIGVTTDGGATWKAGPTVVAGTGEKGWSNSLAVHGDTILFGSNNSRIYRSVDRGATWSWTSTPSLNSTAVALANGRDGLAVFREERLNENSEPRGTFALAATHDGGESWAMVPLPFPVAEPQGITFVPGTERAFLAIQSGVYETEDYGETWRRMLLPEMSLYGVLLDAVTDTKTGELGAYGTNRYSQLMTYREEGAVPVDTSTTDTTVTDTSSTSVYFNRVAGDNAVLHQNRPNPFDSRTTIAFGLATPGYIELALHDARGNVVAVLRKGYFERGEHSVLFDSGDLSPGSYFYTLKVGNRRLTRPLMIVR